MYLIKFPTGVLYYTLSTNNLTVNGRKQVQVQKTERLLNKN